MSTQGVEDHFVASFALRRTVEDRRIIKHETFGPRWHVHHVRVRSAADIDDELRAWLQESHDQVGMQRGHAHKEDWPPRSVSNLPGLRETVLLAAKSFAR